MIRLRAENKIIGYRKFVDGYELYSRDLNWWTGNKISLFVGTEDAFSGLNDKKGRPLFENDLIQVKKKTPYFEFKFIFKLIKTNTGWFLFDAESDESLYLDFLNPKNDSITFLGIFENHRYRSFL